MITYESTLPLEGSEDVIFPLGVTLTKEGRHITAASELKALAEWLDALPEEQLFKEETADAIKGRLFPLLSSYGYEAELHLSTVFSLTKREDIRRVYILPSTEPLLPDHPYENLTECEPDPLEEGLLCFGTVLDGKIVSAASENPHDPEDTVIDIGVETAEGNERHGYAASNVAALAYYLLDPGITVTYIAEDRNPASLRVAEKVGFRPTAKELRIVGYRKE